MICGNNKSITILDVEYEGIKTNADALIKTINTRLHNYNQLTEDTINYIELPEIKKKIIDYIEEFENLQK